MIASWIDLLGAVVLFVTGLYHLQRGDQRLRRSEHWFGDLAALLTALLGGTVLAMGLVLILYSAAFAFLIE